MRRNLRLTESQLRNIVGKCVKRALNEMEENFQCIRREDGKWNYISPDGSLISPEWFDVCYSFKDGFGDVKIDGRWYQIDTQGQISPVSR